MTFYDMASNTRQALVPALSMFAAIQAVGRAALSAVTAALNAVWSSVGLASWRAMFFRGATLALAPALTLAAWQPGSLALSLTAALAPVMAWAAYLTSAKNPEREELVRQWAREREALPRVDLATSTKPVTSTEPVRNTPRRDSLVKLREAVDELLLLREEDIDELLLEEGREILSAVGHGELQTCQ
jgi:hypothetical protein